MLSLRSKNVLEGKMSSVLTCALFKLQKSILMSEGIWVVVFTSTSTDEIKSRGVNREACDQIAEQLTNAAIELNTLNIKVSAP